MKINGWFVAACLCALGSVANAWLGCALDLKWTPAVFVQGVTLFTGVIAFGAWALATEDTQ